GAGRRRGGDPLGGRGARDPLRPPRGGGAPRSLRHTALRRGALRHSARAQRKGGGGTVMVPPPPPCVRGRDQPLPFPLPLFPGASACAIVNCGLLRVSQCSGFAGSPRGFRTRSSIT